MIELELPMIALLTWIAFRQGLADRVIRSIGERVEKIEKILNIPVQMLVGKIDQGEATLSQKAIEEGAEVLSTLRTDSHISSTKNREEQSL